jgi:succinate dehydrogenase flavin-adding protein (antitoxin of CptAB toxin-antitoxin module)
MKDDAAEDKRRRKDMVRGCRRGYLEADQSVSKVCNSERVDNKG